jgi:hypothetical protein
MFMTFTIPLLLYDYDHSSMHHTLLELRFSLSEVKRRDQIVARWDLQSLKRCILSDLLTNLDSITNITYSETKYLDRPRAHR